ncbi:uncharacterized protein si:dkey-154b15.1 [Pleuronectes platessa]|uniref:uncharacterized protein si:dkey-154b15.1 n=1 Tax=Pleuronectes platessa TaxID=8262 RepID=UPI00232A0ACF|nr:uncharacterized protein si:dkey-154b15.1 [Pleuronectes platessa]XP_053302812.1 uncharacterized protein si:dkey-154b15.1 [Pleuronectes platessa]XP_053302813.1 uncharacterized protein si:dkey-154b15.1 [Pleuronectes platessa]XP_053302815.1 uncharacterized protein si:dkey-154b15.1 [Pleuronectes platessa]XP_053302816.1 uncharacterized protein si:dkey-154b15.1 [Pleuronectes platessa]
MDFPVEAKVHLEEFRDDTKVRELLRSHDFQVEDLSRDLVLVKGSFLKLKAVKVRLEELRQNQTEAPPRPASPVSSGAGSRHDPDVRPKSAGERGRLDSRGGSLHTRPSSPHTSAPRVSDPSRPHQNSSPLRAAASPGAREAFRPRSEVLLVEADVFRYAEQVRKKDVDMILENHNVKMSVDKVSDSAEVTLLGKNARMAAGKLQSIFNDLSKSLRTQEVPLRDLDREGKAFLEKIRRRNNVIDSVLVCEMRDRLHLIGSSTRSFEVKQKLLGRSVEPSGRAGRTLGRSSGRRSSSLPPVNRQSTDTRGVAYSSPAGAAGYSPSNYQDDKQEGAKPVRAAGARPPSGASSRRSSSTSRLKGREEKPPDVNRETVKRSKPPGIKLQLVNIKAIDQMIKRTKKKLGI